MQTPAASSSAMYSRWASLHAASRKYSGPGGRSGVASSLIGPDGERVLAVLDPPALAGERPLRTVELGEGRVALDVGLELGGHDPVGHGQRLGVRRAAADDEAVVPAGLQRGVQPAEDLGAVQRQARRAR